MKYIKRFLFVLLQLTWGLPQTFLGFLFFLRFIKYPHTIYKGAINTKWKYDGGISLGLFIFTPDEAAPSRLLSYGGDAEKSAASCERMRVHEFGHCIQSLMLGPLYVFPGLCSVMWSRARRYRTMRIRFGVPYSFFWVESWADRLGERATGRPALGGKAKPRDMEK